MITDDEGRSRPAGADTSIENYYCYDQPVLAPADGIVVDVYDTDPELERAGGFSHPFKRSVTGNRVTIRHADGEYSCLVHLVPGSLEVEPGDRVERGEQIGRCGHSGNSSEPHLHFQLQDHPTFEIAAGIPVRFDHVNAETPGMDVVESTGWDTPGGGPGRYIHAGQRVSHVPEEKPRRNDDTAGALEPTGASRLSGVRMVGNIASGLSVGGFVTVLAGFVVASLQTIALGLAGLAALSLAYLAGRQRMGDYRVRFGSFRTVSGVGLVAALVSVFGTSNMLPELGSFTIGTGVFVTGFLLYIAVWEYGRRNLSRKIPSVNSAGN